MLYYLVVVIGNRWLGVNMRGKNSGRAGPPSIFIVLFVTVAMPAFAQPDNVAVDFRRSDLLTPSGVSMVYRKIEYAAWLSCESPRQPHDEFLSSAADRICQRKLVAATVGKIGDQRLSAFHQFQRAGAGAKDAKSSIRP